MAPALLHEVGQNRKDRNELAVVICVHVVPEVIKRELADIAGTGISDEIHQVIRNAVFFDECVDPGPQFFYVSGVTHDTGNALAIDGPGRIELAGSPLQILLVAGDDTDAAAAFNEFKCRGPSDSPGAA